MKIYLLGHWLLTNNRNIKNKSNSKNIEVKIAIKLSHDQTCKLS